MERPKRTDWKKEKIMKNVQTRQVSAVTAGDSDIQFSNPYPTPAHVAQASEFCNPSAGKVAEFTNPCADPQPEFTNPCPDGKTEFTNPSPGGKPEFTNPRAMAHASGDVDRRRVMSVKVERAQNGHAIAHLR
jgi:hypothetical protein